MLSGNIKVLELLKRSYSTIKKHGDEIGEKTYANMFEAHPEIQSLFANTPPGQAQRLIDAVLFYCEETENFKLYYEQLDKIAHAHIKAGVKDNYYPIMKTAFLTALQEVLGADATDELVHAWAYGFDSLSNELMHIENLIRKYQS